MAGADSRLTIEGRHDRTGARRLALADVTGAGIAATARRVALGGWYFLRTLVLVLHAGRRAKQATAKWQLLLGFGAVVVLLLSLVFTVLAALAALGIWAEPVVSGNAADALALGLTAFTTWLFFSVRPAVREATASLEQLLEYAQQERHAAGVAETLAAALDEVLEAEPDRAVHILGYSLGALVAVDYLCPRASLLPTLDNRHSVAIKSLTTIGLPLDLIRLYLPHYLDDRLARVDDLAWTNIYIAADVLGSNMVDGDDVAENEDPTDEATRGVFGRPREMTAVSIAESRPVSVRYTSEKLTVWNIWGRKGFLAHGGYWDEPESENCLHIVLRQILP